MEFNRCYGCMEEITAFPCPHCGYAPGSKGPDYALRPGSILNGKYIVGRILGQGGFGITYIGWDLMLERKVAVKEYYPSGQVVRQPGASVLQWYGTEQARSARDIGKEMFLKEARKMNKVRKIPQVVQVLDLGAAKDLNLNSGASSMQVAKGGFSPLEQYKQRGGSGTWTDVYALAATIYYALTGTVPTAAVDRVDEDTLRWDLPRLQALPPKGIHALKKAMALRAKDRTQTMEELYRGIAVPEAAQPGICAWFQTPLHTAPLLLHS